MSEGPTGPTGGDRRRLTVPEAATVLGVTVDAVRGRIRRGKLDSGHDEHGGVYVFLDASHGDRRGPFPTVEGPPPDESRLVEALEDQVAHLREQLAAEREANRENRRLLAAALERIPAIEAPRDEAGGLGGTDTPDEPAEPQTGAQEPETAARRPRWLRWLGG